VPKNLHLNDYGSGKQQPQEKYLATTPMGELGRKAPTESEAKSSPEHPDDEYEANFSRTRCPKKQFYSHR